MRLIPKSEKKGKLKFLLFPIVSCLIALLISSESMSQTGDCATSNCVSADIKVSGVKLVQKVNGQYVDLPKTCNSASDQFNVSLQVSFNVTSQTRYGFLITSLIYFDGVPGKSIEQCTTADLPQGPHVIYVDKYEDGTDILWHCGQKMELKATYTAWNNAVTSKSNPSICSYYDPTTKTISANACKAIAPKCRYYGPNESFLVLAPLSTSLSTSSFCGTNNEPYKTYTFNGSASGGFLNPGGTYTYKWYINNILQQSTTTTLTYTPTTGSQFTVKFEAYDQTTPTPVSTSSSTNITPEPCCQISSAPSSASADQDNKCSGTQIQLTVNGGSLGTNAAWKWYAGGCGTANGGTLIGTGSSIPVSPQATTTYYVRAEGDCGTTTCASVTVHVKTSSTAPTSAGVSGDNYCSGTNSSATVSVNGGSLGSGAQWVWYKDGCGTQNGGTQAGTGASLQVSPSQTTTYYVRAEGDCNTTSCASVQVVVKQTPGKPSISVQNNCGSSTLTASGLNNASFTWNDGSADNPRTVTSGGPYTVTQTVNGCTSAASDAASISPKTVPGKPTISVQNNCDGTSTLTASGEAGANFTWSDNATENPHTVSNAGPYTVIQTLANGCSSISSDVAQASPKSQPLKPVVCVVQPLLCGPSKGIVSFAPGAGYQYSIDNGSSWHTNSVFCNLDAGSNPIMKVMDGNGCISDAVTCSEVSSCSSVPSCPPQSQLTTRSGSNEIISNIDAEIKPHPKVTAAPNPFNDKVRFTLKSSVSGLGRLELFNILGQKVKTVFEGYFTAGQIQTVQYTVSGAQRANLIYVFTVGDEKTSGKLINLK